MSSGEVRRVSRQDIQLVQNLIERCLQLYMNQREVVETLLVQAKIEPGFTELVWQKLEEENQDFFKAYYVRLMLKNQIVVFNKLLEQQVTLMHKLAGTGVSSSPVSNGSLHSSSLQPLPRYVSESVVHQPEQPGSAQHQLSYPSDAGSNGILSSCRNLYSPNGTPNHSVKMEVPSNMNLMQTSHLAMLHGLNNEMASESARGCSNGGFSWNGHEENAIVVPSTVGDECAIPFNNSGDSSQATNIVTDESSFGFLGQIPRNFSLSDLTADFSQSSDILESYSRSPFLGADDFLNSPGRECRDNGHFGRD